MNETENILLAEVLSSTDNVDELTDQETEKQIRKLRKKYSPGEDFLTKCGRIVQENKRKTIEEIIKGVWKDV